MYRGKISKGRWGQSGDVIYYPGSSGIYIDGGIFVMYDGKIFENRHPNLIGSGAPCIAIVNDGKYIMFNGEISNNLMTGVRIMDGTFQMYGGSISGNSEDGGIRIDYGQFTMFGGVVYGTKETGVPSELANGHFALLSEQGNQTVAIYGDGTNIMPHIDDNEYSTIHTITGRTRPESIGGSNDN